MVYFQVLLPLVSPGVLHHQWCVPVHLVHPSTRRGLPPKENPYIRLLCQLYKFLARRSESKFNKVVCKRPSRLEGFKETEGWWFGKVMVFIPSQQEVPGTRNNNHGFYGCFSWMIPNLYMGNGCLLGGDLQILADFWFRLYNNIKDFSRI